MTFSGLNRSVEESVNTRWQKEDQRFPAESKTTDRHHRRSKLPDQMAEGVGFEPTELLIALNIRFPIKNATFDTLDSFECYVIVLCVYGKFTQAAG